MTAVPMTAVAVGTTSMLRLNCGRAATATPEYVSVSYTNQWRARTRPHVSAPDTRRRCQGSVPGIGREVAGLIANRVHSGGPSEENRVRLRPSGGRNERDLWDETAYVWVAKLFLGSQAVFGKPVVLGKPTCFLGEANLRGGPAGHRPVALPNGPTRHWR